MKFLKECFHCKKQIVGRTGKKFCDPQCKAGYQYLQAKEQPDQFYNKADNQ